MEILIQKQRVSHRLYAMGIVDITLDIIMLNRHNSLSSIDSNKHHTCQYSTAPLTSNQFERKAYAYDRKITKYDSQFAIQISILLIPI